MTTVVLLLAIMIVTTMLRVSPAAAAAAAAGDDWEGHKDVILLKRLEVLTADGHLTEARHEALQLISRHDCCDRKEVSRAYREGLTTFLARRDVDHQVISKVHNVAEEDAEDCVLGPPSSPDIYSAWDDACSMIIDRRDNHSHRGLSPQSPSSSPFVDGTTNRSHPTWCCSFGPHNPWTYLRLPALEEPAIRLQIPYHPLEQQQQRQHPSDHFVLELEQDGFLRPYQVDAVLWPSGYMLALCMGDLWHCLPELMSSPMSPSPSFVALELGGGIGAASVALARYLDTVVTGGAHDVTLLVASEISPYARMLTASNARYNNHVGPGDSIRTVAMDHLNRTSMRHVKQSMAVDGFDLVFGSSLQDLFHDTGTDDDAPLWRALDLLLSTRNDRALAVLAHTGCDDDDDDDRLRVPFRGRFELVRRISGMDPMFGPMRAFRQDESSDFEICVFRRRRRRRRQRNQVSNEL
jgi:hypothetical protein